MSSITDEAQLRSELCDTREQLVASAAVIDSLRHENDELRKKVVTLECCGKGWMKGEKGKGKKGKVGKVGNGKGPAPATDAPSSGWMDVFLGGVCCAGNRQAVATSNGFLKEDFDYGEDGSDSGNDEPAVFASWK
eukprot:TRINITY_DN50070_c0_g1_i1.p1 TRINITY_DN50070_c0_g1~~TRINITY_DN50070_c0_g1_i1.p1  ORF type:complete len:135 (+),score=19.60 TRINITY_DN50070_c0_g1_i1:125-529(+)